MGDDRAYKPSKKARSSLVIAAPLDNDDVGRCGCECCCECCCCCCTGWAADIVVVGVEDRVLVALDEVLVLPKNAAPPPAA